MKSCRVKLLDANSQQCRWMDGQIDGQAAVCGSPTHNRTSWCEEHHKRVFSRNIRRTRFEIDQAKFYNLTPLKKKSVEYPTEG